MYRILPLLAASLFLFGCDQGSDSTAKDAAAKSEVMAEDSMAKDSKGKDSKAEDSKAEDSSKTSGKAGALDSESKKRSYALGMDIGNSLKGLPVKLETDYVAQGIADVVAGGNTKLSQEEAAKSMQSFVSALETAQAKEADAAAATNSDEGEAFRAKHKKEKGVKVTDSGLQYKVLEEGKGSSPGEQDSVTVHYEGTLTDGTVFDSSRERGEPVTFPVNAVIPGWTEALQMMKEGARYQLVIPPDLAYGERGAGARIGPNETLVFDVELIKVLPGKGEDAESADQ